MIEITFNGQKIQMFEVGNSSTKTYIPYRLKAENANGKLLIKYLNDREEQELLLDFAQVSLPDITITPAAPADLDALILELNTNYFIDFDGGAGGPVTIGGTVTVLPLASTVTNPAIRTSGVGTIPTLWKAYSVCNVGEADAIFNTVTLKAGEGISIGVNANVTTPVINYDATGTTLLITYIL